MKTNQIFHLPRFWQYARAHFREQKRKYFWHFAVIALLCLLLLLLTGTLTNTLSKNRPPYPYFPMSLQQTVYYSGLLMTGGVFALRYFADLSRGESALLWLMQPVSAFEKWLLSAVLTLVFYPLVYTLLFIILTPMPWMWLFIPLVQSDSNTELRYWLIYWGMTAYALTATLIFKRHPIIKSITLGFVIYLLFKLFISSHANMDMVYFYFDNKETTASGTSLIKAYLVVLSVWIMPVILLWTSVFYSLKNRELS